VCSQFWEVETASLIALHERLASQDTALARHVSLARRGAERDFSPSSSNGLHRRTGAIGWQTAAPRLLR
jgi:hypothetical protein